MWAEAEANAKAAELPRHPLPHPQAHPGILAPCLPFPGGRAASLGACPETGRRGRRGIREPRGQLRTRGTERSQGT